MKTVWMSPNVKSSSGGESGIRRVIEAYTRYLPMFDWTVASDPHGAVDLIAVHAGLFLSDQYHAVAHCHGLYWTADYGAAKWEYHANAQVIKSLRQAKTITVPSEWVAETIRRDLRVQPVVIGHGLDMVEWGKPLPNEGYILWNKNRSGDVCDPTPVGHLARARPDLKFISTFRPPTGDYPNLQVTGVMAHSEMKSLVKSAAVYLGTTKETFGIGTLEALASGVPVLGYAHGGILEMVQHGVNGYLARPGDASDLEAGLAYILANRAVLSRNAIELAQSFTWPKQVAKVAKVYNDSEHKILPYTAIVIPTYNYADKVGKAIASAQAQDFPLLRRIIVVDDGSPDDGATARVVEAIAATDPRVVYLRKENGGVATARNFGIDRAYQQGDKYVCCLDADDWIEPNFITTCVKALEGDPCLGIAYTGLQYHKPDGESKLSQWPQDWNFDAQLLRRNQVPTCCVFRIDLWRRLGGYRQRYAPRGAGSEDAEFWTRCGAYGMSAKKVSDRGLFHYSWMTGQVSGDKAYKEVDWLSWHPWATKEGNGKHPFASWANPTNRISHPVRQYDEPAISVIIPLGPDHVDIVWDALDSLDAQTFTRWEAIVVNDTGHDLNPALTDAFPHVRWISTQAGPRGAGHARNRGAEAARGPLITFLDADDYLLPDCLQLMLDAWSADGAIVYSDYRGSAIIHDPSQLAKDLQDRLYQWDEKTKKAIIGYRAADYDCERAIVQPEKPFYHWALVTCLIPKLWHDEIGGYDEAMASWEDVDYHYRLARNGRCFIRVAEELVAYRFGTGSRRELGLEDHKNLIEYMRKKYREIKTMGCGCRGGKSNVVRTIRTASGPVTIPSRSYSFPDNPLAKESTMSDENFVLIRYLHPNRGDHPVIGPETRIKYGMRSSGEEFLVDMRDVQGAPHLFQLVQKAVQAPTIVNIPATPTPAPAPVKSGIGWGSLTPKAIKALEAAGFSSLDDLRGMSEAGLVTIKGITPTTAKKIAADLLA